jgi:O-methyltransferase involved in polyketide biosynthesis
MNDLPFKETSLGNNECVREFSEDLDTHELEWHIDKEDRIVEVVKNDGWEVQIDNELPKLLNNKLFIPKETYHRVIKGKGKLIVKITKL